jgi:hypothetical protein
MLPPDGVAPIESITATSLMGWGAFIISLLTFGMVTWDRVINRGRSLQSIDGKFKVIDGKIDHLCEQIDDMEGKFEVVDGLAESVRELTQEWRGVPGSDNGYRSIIRKHTDRIEAIEKRNTGIDAVRQEEMRLGGGHQRRHMDRELNNLMPEEREEKG